MLDLKQDYFALFGLPTGFTIDMDRLEQAYLDIQGRVHPDRFAHLSDADKRLSMQWATHANEAFRTLKSPLTRGQYLLELQGVDPAFETNTAMSSDFLMEQMEWREALGEAREAADEEVLEDLSRRIRHANRTLIEQLGEELDQKRDLRAAADTVRRLKFLEKLQHEINDALTALES
ncbi:Fe-S protein assembly co-chaperone HscB [Zoogloea sp.]|uniref:Fe-S protein assembly co-chaperone HscB n=1 Tax=Zoogloea sp. TaxID=49181 RepID=UPI001AD4D1F9|nr:Fe-S protein assembly co-chaperone HscB [Zoogloea sp.]MBN8281553.1 Fe-S protein assembly co-chaperone HscB [Zoogloea sp.]